MKKTIKSNECNGFLSVQMKSSNSISLCAEISRNVKIENIRLIGKLEINGVKHTNPVLENLDGVVIQHHKNSEDGAIVTAYFLEGLPENLRTDILNTVISDFELDCIEVCPCCGK